MNSLYCGPFFISSDDENDIVTEERGKRNKQIQIRRWEHGADFVRDWASFVTPDTWTQTENTVANTSN